MSCACAAELAWKSSLFFQQDINHPSHPRAWHAHSNTLLYRSRTGWLLQSLTGLSSLNLDRNERGPCNTHRTCGLFQNRNAPFSLNFKAPCSRAIVRAGRGRPGFLFQNPEGGLFLSLKANEKRPCRRVTVQAGRSKPRFSQHRRAKRPSGEQPDPAGNIHKKKPDQSKPLEPYVRHPDDYYKFGPHGPYDYKAGVVGELIPVTSMDQDYILTWSNVKDLKEQEQIDIYDACVLYNNRVQTFDLSRVQFFYVFARLPFHIGPEPPWKQWTLVAEVAVESAESLDKLSLISRLSDHTRNKITKFTGWFRPDLIYVKPKRRRYQVRFELETDFIRELESLLMESVGEPHERDSYYGEFCQILGLDVSATHEEITSTYEESSEKVQLACLEHLLSKHPVQLLPYMPYPNRAVWMSRQSSGELNKTSSSEASMSTEPHGHIGSEEEESVFFQDYENEGPSESDEDENMEEESEDWGDIDDPATHAKMAESFLKLKDEELAMLNQQAPDDDEGNATDSEDEDFVGKGGDASAGDQSISDTRVGEGHSILKAAARPYTYVNLIREMVILRKTLLHEKGSLQQMEAGQAQLRLRE